MKIKNNICIIKSRNAEERKMKTKMRNNAKLKLSFLTMLTVIALFGLVEAVNAASFSCNMSIPSVVNKLTPLNVSYNTTSTATADFEIITVLFEALSGSTFNSSFSVVANSTNTTNNRHVNLTFGDDIQLPDAPDYQFRATCFNGSGALSGNEGGVTTSTVTGIRLDRSNPVVTGINNIGTNIKASSATITFGVQNTTHWELLKNGVIVTGAKVTSNFSNQSKSVTFTLGSKGEYQIRVKDGTNTTTSTAISYSVAASSTKDKERIVERREAKETQETQQITKKNATILIISVLVAVVFVITLFIVNSGKKRRR